MYKQGSLALYNLSKLSGSQSQLFFFCICQHALSGLPVFSCPHIALLSNTTGLYSSAPSSPKRYLSTLARVADQQESPSFSNTGLSRLQVRFCVFAGFLLTLFKALLILNTYAQHIYSQLPIPYHQLKGFLTIGQQKVASGICKYLLISLISGL